MPEAGRRQVGSDQPNDMSLPDHIGDVTHEELGEAGNEASRGQPRMT